MEDFKTFRRDWGTDQKRLRELFKIGSETEARDLLLTQHGVLHSQDVSGTNDWSYADEIFKGLVPDLYRTIPRGKEHSLIWILWHISRIEDITMNILIAGEDQIYLRDGWKENLGSPVDHTGNHAPLVDSEEITRILDPEILKQYRNAVGRGTRAVINETLSSSWENKVQPDRLERLVTEGAVLPAAEGLLAYWGKRRIFELFLMPPTRHLMTHLNEAYSMVQILMRS